MQVLDDEAGHDLFAFLETVPFIVAGPVLDGAAAKAEDFGDLCLGEVCLDVQGFGLLVEV